jgi:hypothetical protein
MRDLRCPLSIAICFPGGIQVHQSFTLLNEMALHAGICQSRISFAKRFEELPVLLHGLFKAVFVVQLSVTVEENFLPETIQDADEIFIAGELLDQNMEFGEELLSQSYPCGVSGGKLFIKYKL